MTITRQCHLSQEGVPKARAYDQSNLQASLIQNFIEVQRMAKVQLRWVIYVYFLNAFYKIQSSTGVLH